MYMTVKQAAEKWGISDRRVRILCSEGKIPGVTREGRSWKIPEICLIYHYLNLCVMSLAYQ